MEKLSIYILTNINRGYIEEIITSLANSKIVKRNARVIISTNTTDKAYREYLVEICRSANAELILHEECDAHIHAHNIYVQCQTKLCMMLHDDDEIIIDNFERYIALVCKNDDYGSYSCNDRIILNDRYKANKIKEGDNRFVSNFETALCYLLNRHYVCYPTIIYNKEKLNIDFREKYFGKHTDALLVVKLVRFGHLFCGYPSLGYRIHAQQDSAEKSMSKVFLKIFLIFVLVFNLNKIFNVKLAWKRIRYHDYN